jgi:putative transposase
MWTPTTRQKHSRTVTRYQTDLTDTEWRVIAPHLPKPCAAGRSNGLLDRNEAC